MEEVLLCRAIECARCLVYFVVEEEKSSIKSFQE